MLPTFLKRKARHDYCVVEYRNQFDESNLPTWNTYCKLLGWVCGVSVYTLRLFVVFFRGRRKSAAYMENIP